MGSPVDEAGRWRHQGVDSLVGEQDGVAGGLGELFDADIDAAIVAAPSSI